MDLAATEAPQTDKEVKEDPLVSEAAEAVTDKMWVTGRCAHKWTRFYARRRSDADFAQLIDSSRAFVNFSRRIFEGFAKYKGDLHFSSRNWRQLLPVDGIEASIEVLLGDDHLEPTIENLLQLHRARSGGQFNVLDSLPLPRALKSPAPLEKSSVEPYVRPNHQEDKEAAQSRIQQEADAVREFAADVPTEVPEYAPFKTSATLTKPGNLIVATAVATSPASDTSSDSSQSPESGAQVAPKDFTPCE